MPSVVEATVENAGSPNGDAASTFAHPTLEVRVVIAVGEQARERMALDAVSAGAATGGHAFRVVRRCVAADQLLNALTDGDFDVALVGVDLHGLGIDGLRRLCRGDVPLVLWGASPALPHDDAARHGSQVIRLPLEVRPEDLLEALRTAASRHQPARWRSRGDAARNGHSRATPIGSDDGLGTAAASAVAVPLPTGTGMLLAVVGVTGGVGTSTVAAGLSGGLARSATTALLDFDTMTPSLAVALDLNPARNLSMIANDPPGEAACRWTAALESEMQPLDRALPRGVVLAGLARPGTAGGGIDWVRQVLRHAQAQEEFVVADLGAYLHSSTVGFAFQAEALAAADRVLVVATPDIVGLRRAAALLERLRGQFAGPKERIALVLNRHHGRYHHAAAEVADVLGVSVAAVIPDDRDGVQRALARRRVITACNENPRGSAARALVELAVKLAELRGQRQTTAGWHLRSLSRLRGVSWSRRRHS